MERSIDIKHVIQIFNCDWYFNEGSVFSNEFVFSFFITTQSVKLRNPKDGPVKSLYSVQTPYFYTFLLYSLSLSIQS